MTTIRVDYLVDNTVCREEFDVPDASRVNCKVFDSGRGYVKLPDLITIYARAERIQVEGPIAGGGS